MSPPPPARQPAPAPLRHLATTALALLTLTLVASQKTPKTPSTAEAVTIKDMAYTPADLTIKPGTQVTWTNNDDRDHSVRAINGSFDSGNLSPKSTYSHTFKSAGTYSYGCSLHPRMRGKITVK